MREIEKYALLGAVFGVLWWTEVLPRELVRAYEVVKEWVVS